jgi:hypothetical protein
VCVIYPKDAVYIVKAAAVGPGSVVAEAGTGSGFLTGDNECGMKIQELLGVESLGTPLDVEASVGGYDLRDLACGEKRAEVWLRLSQRY